MRRHCAILFASLLAACATSSGVTIHADQNPAADFGRYARYAWASAPLHQGEWPPPDDRTAFDWKVRRLVDEQLADRGYRRVAASESDFLVDYRITTRERELTDSFRDYAQYRAAGGTESPGEAWVQGYREGSLIVEATDAHTRALVWYGSATAVVNPALRAKRLPDAIRRIFERFPQHG